MSQLVLPSLAAYGFANTRTAFAGSVGKELQQRQREIQVSYPARERFAQELANLEDPTVTSSWYDGDASPARAEAIAAAMRFLLKLPTALLSDLEISPDRDGSVSFDWYVSPERQLSISLSADGMLHYAAILGPIERTNGRLLFDDSLPEEITRLLARIARS